MLYLIIGVIVVHNIRLQLQMDRTKLVIRAMLELMSDEDD
jgi:hypothetical protein